MRHYNLQLWQLKWSSWISSWPTWKTSFCLVSLSCAVSMSVIFRLIFHHKVTQIWKPHWKQFCPKYLNLGLQASSSPVATSRLFVQQPGHFLQPEEKLITAITLELLVDLMLKNGCVQHYLWTNVIHVIISPGLFLLILKYLFCQLNIKMLLSDHESTLFHELRAGRNKENKIKWTFSKNRWKRTR